MRPLPLQRALVEHLRAAEPDLWRWFESAEADAKREGDVRRELLKATYRLDRAAHEAVYTAADRARERLGVDAVVTFYQAQGETEVNAGLLMLGGEAHIVFSGGIEALLDERELEFVVAHELAHFGLWREDGGAYFTAERMLTAFANDPRAKRAHDVSEQRFALATEIYADRGGADVVGDFGVAVSALVKLSTGLRSVDAASYLRQADEIFTGAGAAVVSEGVTHPEPFIRARALRLWHEEGEAADPAIESMIRGPLDVDALDLAQQARLTGLTERLLDAVLAPEWLQTDEVLAHARLFSPKANPDGRGAAEVESEWRRTFEAAKPSIAEYVGYVLLDFAVADPDVHDAALAHMLAASERLAIGQAFDAIVMRELGLSRSEVARRRAEAA